MSRKISGKAAECRVNVQEAQCVSSTADNRKL